MSDNWTNRPASVSHVGKRETQITGHWGGTSLRLAWLLAMLATLMFEIAAADGDRPAWLTALIVLFEALFAIALSSICWRFDQATHALIASRLIRVLCLATAPYVIEVVVRISTGSMLPLELLLLSYFRNAVLALAVFAYREDSRRWCCAFSMYLAIFCSALSSQSWILGLTVVFAIAGVWWLMTTYWESLQHSLVATSQRHMPRRWIIAVPLLLLLLAAVAVPVAGTPVHALWGFMPSSGGTDRYSESARQGVGDGDALVAGTDNIQSFAPIEDAPFLTSHDPSLYDLFDDSYNEPIKPQKSDRAIALPSELALNRPQERHPAESKLAGKEFSTLRKAGPPKRSEVGNRDSAALLYVKGRVPLHLKLEIFDLYDGIEWSPEPLPTGQGDLRMQTLNGRPWLRTPVGSALEMYGIPESHALKIIRLDTNRVPSPTQFLGVHVDKLDRADFYHWAQSDIVRMDRDKLPSLTVMHVQSRVPDERLVPGAYLFLQGGGANHRSLANDTESKRIRELAQLWVQDVAPGWEQVRAITGHLRTEYTHDRESKPPSDCQHTVSHFLFESRSGPDYLFASATVLLLRSLGYSARLVSGFYAEPSRYDVRSRQTAVLNNDVHFWAEVRVGLCDWIPVEPTPGYELLPPPLTTGEQLLAAMYSAWGYIIDHIMILTAGVALLFFLIGTRMAASDLMATFAWWVVPVSGERDMVRRTMWLMNRRIRSVGFSRPEGVTESRWLRLLASFENGDEHSPFQQLANLADWAAFAPEFVPPPSTDCMAICRNCVRGWPRHQMVELKTIGQSVGMSSRAAELLQNTGLLHALLHEGACLSKGIVG